MGYFFKDTPCGPVLYIREKIRNAKNDFIERKATPEETNNFFVEYYDKEINELFLQNEVNYLKDVVRSLERKLKLYEK